MGEKEGPQQVRCQCPLPGSSESLFQVVCQAAPSKCLVDSSERLWPGVRTAHSVKAEDHSSGMPSTMRGPVRVGSSGWDSPQLC